MVGVGVKLYVHYYALRWTSQMMIISQGTLITSLTISMYTILMWVTVTNLKLTVRIITHLWSIGGRLGGAMGACAPPEKILHYLKKLKKVDHHGLLSKKFFYPRVYTLFPF